MRTVNEGETGNANLFFLAQPQYPDKCGGHNCDLSRHCVVSDVNASVSNALSCELRGQLQPSKSAPTKAKLSCATVEANGQPERMAVDEEPALHGMRSPGCDLSRGASGSLSHAGAKRARAVAFTGTAASTDTEPLLPLKSRRVTSLPSQIGQEGVGEPSAALPHASELTSSSRHPIHHGQNLASLFACATSAMRGGGGGGAVSSRPASVSLPRGPRTSTSSIRNDWGTTSGSQLTALLSSASPAVVEQLLAAARTVSALPEPGHDVNATGTAVSAETTAGAPPATRSSASHLPSTSLLRGDRQARPAEPDPDGSARVSSAANARAAATAATATMMTSCAQPCYPGSTGKTSGVREAREGSSGYPVDTTNGAPLRPGLPARCQSGGVAGQAAAAAAAASAGGNALTGPVGSGELRRQGGTTAVAAARQAALRAVADPRGVQTPADSGECKWLAQKATAEPAVASASEQQALDQATQATEPLTAQVVAALPPELAARLKKPIRIIQPISRTWEQETLQCGSGPSAAAAATAAPPADVKPTTGHGRAKDRPESDCKSTCVVPGAAGASGLGGAGDLTGASTQPCSPVGGANAAAAAPSPVVAAFAAACGGAPPRPHATAAGPLADGAQLAAFAPALAALASFPQAADSASPFTAGYSFMHAASGPTTGSTTAAIFPPSYGSSVTTASGTLPTGVIQALSSGGLTNGPSGGLSWPGRSGDWGRFGAAVGAADGIVGPSLATQAGRHGDTSTAAAIRPAGLHPNGVTAVCDVMSPPRVSGASIAAAAAAGPSGPAGLLPLPPRPSLLQRPASTAAASVASSSCLGKVQGELTLLYQWYVANKTVYLDQAHRQLQRIEALTAAREGAGEAAGGADAAAAASAKVESAEAVRAFETALKIMSVCGRVEQQWLALPTGPPPGAERDTLEVPPPPAAPLMPPPAFTPPLPVGPSRALTGAGSPGIPAVGPGLSALDPGAKADGMQLPLNVPAPASGWSHGAGAALAVAAALVGSVSQRGGGGGGGLPAGPVGPDEPPLAAGLPGATMRGAAAGAAAASGPGARSSYGLPLSWTLPGMKAVAATGPSRLSMAAVPSPPPPPMPPPRGAAVAVPPKTTRMGQPAAA